MTVSTTISKSGPYNSGTTGPFSYAFYITDEDELRVILTSAAGVETDLTITTDYTVAGVGEAAGGTVTLVEAPDFAGGELLTLKRAVPQVQETEIRNQGAFYPAVHEAVFDRLQMQIQDLTEEVDRAVKVSVSASDTPDELLAAITEAAAEATAAAAIVEPLAADLVAVAAIDTEIAAVSAIAANVTTVAGIAANVSTVAGVAANVTTVAGIAANVTTVAGDTAAIATVSGDTAAINTVAGDTAAIGTLAALDTEITALGALGAQLTTLGALGTELTTLGALGTEITALGSGDALAGLEAVGAAGAVTDSFPFIAGYSSTMTGVNVEVRDYGEFDVDRAFEVTGEVGGCTTAPTGADMIFDIEKNGNTIYTTKPKIAAGATDLTAGTLKSDGTQIFAAGDTITFSVTQVGSTIPGQKARLTVIASYV